MLYISFLLWIGSATFASRLFENDIDTYHVHRSHRQIANDQLARMQQFPDRYGPHCQLISINTLISHPQEEIFRDGYRYFILATYADLFRFSQRENFNRLLDPNCYHLIVDVYPKKDKPTCWNSEGRIEIDINLIPNPIELISLTIPEGDVICKYKFWLHTASSLSINSFRSNPTYERR